MVFEYGAWVRRSTHSICSQIVQPFRRSLCDALLSTFIKHMQCDPLINRAREARLVVEGVALSLFADLQSDASHNKRLENACCFSTCAEWLARDQSAETCAQ
jgi:hypothetical protein